MSARDPDTGRFVSRDAGPGEHLDPADLVSVFGKANYNTPAADNTGATESQDISGIGTDIIDFDAFLEHDEEFLARVAHWSVVLWLPSTATAEGTAVFDWAMGEGIDATEDDAIFSDGLHQYGGSPEHDFSINRSTESGIDGQYIATGVTTAEASFRDTVNTLGGGGVHGRSEGTVNYWAAGAMGERFDDNDQLRLVGRLNHQEVADHGISIVGTITMSGVVLES